MWSQNRKLFVHDAVGCQVQCRRKLTGETTNDQCFIIFKSATCSNQIPCTSHFKAMPLSANIAMLFIVLEKNKASTEMFSLNFQFS